MSQNNPVTVIPKKQMDHEMGFQPSNFKITEEIEFE